METTRKNYKSDFDFLLPLTVRVPLPSGRYGRAELGWPAFDWEARFWTWSRSKPFVVSCQRGVAVNCFDDGGRIHVVAKGHGLGPGTLHCEFRADMPDAIYPDGTRLEVTDDDLAIELVRGPGDCTTAISAELRLPVVGIGAVAAESFSAAEMEEIIAEAANMIINP